VPSAAQKQAGIGPGDVIEFTASKGKITIRTAPKESRYATYKPTNTETAAIRRGRAAYKRGDYISLSELQEQLDIAHRRARRSRKAS
jgi:hypothetical protein